MPPVMFSTTTLDELAGRLSRERERTVALLRGVQRDLDALADADVSNMLDYESPTGGAEQMDRERLRALHTMATVALADVDAATHRLREGIYGWCRDCDGRIPLARLRAVPTAMRCVRCECTSRALSARVG